MKKTCSICGKAEAVLEVSRLGKDGKPAELSVCAECARQHGFMPGAKARPAAANAMAELKESVAAADAELVCPGCAMSYAEFKRLGRAGCAQCYAAFGAQIQPLVRRIHGSAQHIGRATRDGHKPAQEQAELARLRSELAVAVEQEDYEKAASLRDELARNGDESGG